MSVTSTSPAPVKKRLKKRGRGSEPLDRVLHALNHPLRRRILRVLTQRSGSASSLSREFGMSLGVVSYHLNQVLANECKVVEIVKAVPKRGAIEKFYRLKRGTLTAEFSDLPAGLGADGPLCALSLEECLLAGVEAIEARTTGPRDRGSWEWFSVELDADGWQEVHAARADFNSRITQAVEGSRSRAGEEGAEAAVIGAVALPASTSLSSEADG